MNRKALQKAIDALNLGTPDKICFALGILETLIESLPEKEHIHDDKSFVPVFPKVITPTQTDEASILDAQARIALEKFKTFNQTNNV